MLYTSITNSRLAVLRPLERPHRPSQSMFQDMRVYKPALRMHKSPVFVAMFAASVTLGIVAGAVTGAVASRIPDRTRVLAPRSSSSGTGLKTWSIASASSASDGSIDSLSNTFDNWYLANITIGGSEVTVQLDTGSTDLVLFSDQPIDIINVIPNSYVNDTYGTGWFDGPIATAKLEFGGYTVESQAFLNGTSVNEWNIEVMLPLGIRGIMGIAVDSESTSGIIYELDNLYESQPGKAEEIGRNVIANVFEQNAGLGNFTVVSLGRTDDGEGTGEGSLAIGEYPEGLENQFAQTSAVDAFTPGAARWTVPVDAMAVNSKTLALESAIQGAPSGKAIALIDTGTSKAMVSQAVLSAMYSGIPDAWYSTGLGVWVVPCTADAPNITVTIGGRAYYIHPLDLTDIRTAQDFTFCTSSFSILGFDQSAFDFILGDTFMRNVYTYFYYGDFDETGTIVDSPSIKLVTSSHGVDADYADYSIRRRQNLASFPPEGTKAQIQQAFPQTGPGSSEASVSDAAASQSVDPYQAFVDKLDGFAPVVIGLLGAILVVLLGLLGVGVAICIRRGRVVGAGRSVNYTPVPIRFKEPEGEYKDDVNVRYNQ
ncbi:unnamed protein product [Peniophora sp. CBMAI 1063]|nr:unnamed protein product [Peniophora sp. CBMAI 1063]